jgi:methionyl-tRNA synthetase
MPATSAKILAQLNASRCVIQDEFAPSLFAGHKIGTPAVLFTKIEDSQVC